MQVATDRLRWQQQSPSSPSPPQEDGKTREEEEGVASAPEREGQCVQYVSVDPAPAWEEGGKAAASVNTNVEGTEVMDVTDVAQLRRLLLDTSLSLFLR